MEFKPAKLDRLSSLISIITTGFLLFLSISFIQKGIPYGWIFSSGIMSIVIISYLLSPKRYYIHGGEFIIEKVIGKKLVIPLNMIEGYINVEDFNKLKPVRSMGNGGLFGYYGIYTTKEYGNINCQLTRLKNILIIRSKKGYFAISPEKPEMLMDWLKSNIGASIVETSAEVEVIKTKRDFYILLIPDAVLALTIIMIILLYQQLPERIATHFDFQGNPDGWSPRVAFLYFGIFPQVILFALSIIIFFVTRNRYRDPRAVNLLVLIISLIQIFVAYTSFDIYWFNTHSTHFIPIFYAIAILTVLLLILLYFYNKILKKS